MVSEQYLLVTVITALLSLIAGFFVLAQHKKSATHIVFFILSVDLTIMTIFNYLSIYGVSLDVQELGVRVVMATTTILVVLVYLLFRYIDYTDPITTKRERAVMFITLFTIALHATDIYLVGVEQGAESITPVVGPGILLFVIHFVTVLVLSLGRLLRGWVAHRSDYRRNMQYRLLMIGTLPSLFFALVVSIILPMLFGWTHLVFLTPIYPVFFLICVGYSIVRHGLFDIRLAAIRSLGYILTIGLMAVVYIGLAYAFSLLFFKGDIVDGVSFSPISVVLALVLALIFQPIKQFFDRLTNNLFYRSDYSSEVFLREFGRILSFDTDLRLLLRQASSYITTTLGSEKAFFYIAGRGVLGQSGGKKVRIPDVDVESLEKYYLKNHESPEVIMLERLEDEKIIRILQSYQVKIVLPLILQKQAIGFLFIGEHKSRGYAMRDIKVLESIANELTIAVQNSLSVEEIRDLNESLQGRVDEATAELRSNNRQLQRLDEAKNEFISMASHQLRTPLTSIKGYLDMILQGDLGKITNTQKTVLSEAFLSSERMVSLINDFLNVSRLQTGKFVIEKRDCNLSDIVKEQLQMLNVVAKQYDLKLQVDLCKNAPSVKLDEEKVRQVVLNFIDNAIYYSPAKSTIKVSLSCSKDKILFKVVDQGIGIPKMEQAGLFTKFYRASNARKRRPDGTGVGLFLAKKVITAHGGEIIFESIENKGSTFGFSLPAPPSKTPKKG